MSLVNFTSGPGPVGQIVRVSTTSPVITTQAPITLKGTYEYNMVDKLLDVDISARSNNSVLIYNEAREIYEVKSLEVLTGTIDGGTY